VEEPEDNSNCKGEKWKFERESAWRSKTIVAMEKKQKFVKCNIKL
jgi:hypothetical protein